jgi:hypothetical protein
MKSTDAHTCLNALAQERRLNQFRLFVQASDGGMAETGCREPAALCAPTMKRSRKAV